MDTNIVFVKTEKGRSEIETRDHNINFKLRIALILVNGKSAVSEMLGKIPGDGIASLESLHRDGYIEVVGGGNAASTVIAPAAAIAPQVSANNNAPAEKSEFNLETAKRQAVRMIESVLGPSGESMAMAIERCKSRDDFEKQAKRAVEIISQVGGPRKAQEFLTQTGLQ